MKLSDLIRENLEKLAMEWESFARTCSPAAAHMNVTQLRDHILPLLRFVADDMDSPQSGAEQKTKSVGHQLRQNTDSEAEQHAALRIIDGFTIDQVVGEFRALRASVLRLWLSQQPGNDIAPEEITRFNESIDQMLSESVVRHAALEEEAREKSTRTDALLATLSHELATPLSAIAMGLHLLKAEGDTNPKLAPVTAMMTRQARHLKRLFEDLLDLARISKDRIVLQVSATDIRECVQDAVEANRPLITQKEHVMTLDMPAQALMAEVDRIRIVEVVSNLLNNAARYSPPGSSIKISLTRDEENVMISVKDDGLGIEAEALPKIFDAFYSNHEVDKAQAELGIGLWLTRNLVELHAGTTVAKSEGLGRGTEFCVTIPLRHCVDCFDPAPS